MSRDVPGRERVEPSAQTACAVSLHAALQGVRAVLFDVGGTLMHPDYARLARIVAETCGHAFTPAQLRRTLKEVMREIAFELQAGREPAMCDHRPHWVFRRLFATLGLAPAQMRALDEGLRAAHAARHLWCELDPEAHGVVSALKGAGLRLAVISNTEDGRVGELLRLVGLAPQFEFCLDSHVVGIHKPDPRIFQLALEQLGLAPAEAAYVGDSYGHDALASLAVGMRAVLLDPLDLHPESVCPRIRRLAELTGAAPARD